MTTNTKTNVNLDSITKKIGSKGAQISCLLDLLSEHPDIQKNPTLLGSIQSACEQIAEFCNELDDEVEKIARDLAA